MTDDVTVAVHADVSEFQRALEGLTPLAAEFGAQLTNALKSAVVSGRSLEEVLRQIGLSLAGSALNRALQPLQTLATTFFTGLFSGIGGQAAGAAAPLPFAAPAMAAAPSFLDAGSLGGGRGMNSSAGTSGRDARAPQALTMSADPSSRVSIVFNVTTADATSFRKSEAQVTGMLARAVSRGARSL